MKKGLLLLLVSMYALFINAGSPIIIVKNGGVPSEGDQTNPSTYNLRYAIWAGPEGGLDFTQNGFHNSYSINEAPSTFASRISAGEGRLVNKNEMIYGKVELVPVPKK